MSGVTFNSTETLIVAAPPLGIVNAFMRPRPTPKPIPSTTTRTRRSPVQALHVATRGSIRQSGRDDSAARTAY
jgi:hypothetical protein